MILSGDVGGTHTRLGLFQARGQRAVRQRTYASREHANLEEIVRLFLRESPRAEITRACFGIAGPVKNGRCDATNLPWLVDSRSLARMLELRKVGLINDLEANAWGISVLGKSELAGLQRGAPVRKSNAAVISAGTGLGEAGLYWDGQGHRPFPSEGGHSDFAPRTELEMELWRELHAQFGRVSYERVVSGPGIVNVYNFLRRRRPGSESKALAEELRKQDAAAVISRHALRADNALCEQTLEIFVSVYGAEAGNLALTMMATAGIYLGGGIAPKILPLLRGPTFVKAFYDKGRLRPLLEAVPVKVILNEHAALLGGAQWAARQ